MLFPSKQSGNSRFGLGWELRFFGFFCFCLFFFARFYNSLLPSEEM